MGYKLGGLIKADIVVCPPEVKAQLERAGKPVPVAKQPISASEKHVLEIMASYADDDTGRNVYCSRSTMAGKALCSIKSVDRAIAKFLADGVIAYDEPVDRKGNPIRTRVRCYRIYVWRALDLYPERAPNSDIMSQVKGDIMSQLQKGNSDNGVAKSDIQDHEQRHDVAESCLREDSESLARAREGGAAPEGAPPSAPSDPGHKLQAAIAVFKEKLPAMREAVGEEGWKLIGPDLFVVGASPGHMLLGQPTRFLADLTLDRRAALERATGCRIEVVDRMCPKRKGAA